MREWLNTLLSLLCSHPVMDRYELDFTVPSPRNFTTFMEFSPNGRFLAVGDRDSSLHILDRLTRFHPAISATTPTKPTALVWETSKSLYVGFSDGRFTYYQIDLGGNRLVKGSTNGFFYGQFPTTAMALDVESRTLVLSVGPDVFAFRRIRTTGKLHSFTHQARKLTLVETNSASSAIYRVVSISKETPETLPLHFRDPFVLPPTTPSSLHFVGKT